MNEQRSDFSRKASKHDASGGHVLSPCAVEISTFGGLAEQTPVCRMMGVELHEPPMKTQLALLYSHVFTGP